MNIFDLYLDKIIFLIKNLQKNNLIKLPDNLDKIDVVSDKEDTITIAS